MCLSLLTPAALAQLDGGAPDAGRVRADVPALQGDASVEGDVTDPADEPLSPDEQHAAERAAPDIEDPADAGVSTGTREGAEVPEVPRAAVEIASLTDRACLRALSRTGVPFIRVRQRGRARSAQRHR